MAVTGAEAIRAGLVTCCDDTGTPFTYLMSCPVERSSTSRSELAASAGFAFDADVADHPRAAVIPNTVVEVSPVARILPMVARR